jgi:methanogenic corrinoid protein MtbC1
LKLKIQKVSYKLYQKEKIKKEEIIKILEQMKKNKLIKEEEEYEKEKKKIEEIFGEKEYEINEYIEKLKDEKIKVLEIYEMYFGKIMKNVENLIKNNNLFEMKEIKCKRKKISYLKNYEKEWKEIYIEIKDGFLIEKRNEFILNNEGIYY